MNGRPLDRAVTHDDSRAAGTTTPSISDKRRAYDAYQSMLMEPWDGPAAIAFTDGRILGAALDRNGLRPARYYVTRDDRHHPLVRGRHHRRGPGKRAAGTGCLGPGEMLEVDPAQGRVIWNDEIRDRLRQREALPRLARRGDASTISDLREPAAGELACRPRRGRPAAPRRMAQPGLPLRRRGRGHPAHGQPRPRCLWPPWAWTRRWRASPRRPARFFDYFNQLFAQVTNPPIDALRESLVTSQVLYLGNHGNLLEDCRDTCRLVRLQGPMLTQGRLRAHLRHRPRGLQDRAPDLLLSAHWREGRARCGARPPGGRRRGRRCVTAPTSLCSPTAPPPARCPIPSLLSLGCVHNHLIRVGLRIERRPGGGDRRRHATRTTSPAWWATPPPASTPTWPTSASADLLRDAARIELPVEEAAGQLRPRRHGRHRLHHVQDGHLHHAGLPLRPDLRGAWASPMTWLSSYFTSHGHAHRRPWRQWRPARAHRALRQPLAPWPRPPRPTQLPTLGLTKWRPHGRRGAPDQPARPSTCCSTRLPRGRATSMFKRVQRLRATCPGRAVTLRDLMDFAPKGAAGAA